MKNSLFCLPEGREVGRETGLQVGCLVGCEVGCKVGCKVGCEEGWPEGKEKEGLKVGAKEGVVGLEEVREGKADGEGVGELGTTPIDIMYDLNSW